MELQKVNNEFELRKLQITEKDQRYRLLVDHQHTLNKHLETCLNQVPERHISKGYFVTDIIEKTLNPHCQKLTMLIENTQRSINQLAGHTEETKPKTIEHEKRDEQDL